MKNPMTRRDFVVKGSTVLVGAGLSLKTGCRRATAPAAAGRVVEVSRAEAVLENRAVQADVVRDMLHRGMTALTQSEKPWSQFFSPSDRIGLKINTLGRPFLYTHHELIRAVADELIDSGIPENNIIVWDRWEHHMQDCGFTVNASDQGVRCYGAQNRNDSSVYRWDPEVFYESDHDTAEERAEGSTRSQFSSIFTRECDKVINLPILKDHANSGVTFCLKNLAYGITTNNNRFHRPDFISTFIADICAQPQVRDKVVLHIGDILEGCFERGPMPRTPRELFTPGTIMLGTDPVAMDALGRRMVDEQRIGHGLTPLAETPGYYEGMRPVQHIELAAQNGLGVCDLEAIQVEEIR